MQMRLCLVGLALATACGGDQAKSAVDSDAALPADAGEGAADAGGGGPDGGTVEGLGSVEVREENGLRVVTFTTVPFVVEPNQERYVCQNFANPFDSDVAIVRSSSEMAEGSHHMFAFQSGVTSGPLVDCSGLEFGPSAHSSQVPERTVEYPAGVARLHKASDGLRIQAHYLNVTAEPIEARVKVTLYTTETDGQQLAASLFFNNLAVSVAPNSEGFAEKTCTLSQDITLLNVIHHMHRFGTHFEATLDDGTVLHESDEWSEPEERKFDPPLHLPAGTQITFRCDYINDTDQPLSFGESALTNEMCILAGQFYPALDGGMVCM